MLKNIDFLETKKYVFQDLSEWYSGREFLDAVEMLRRGGVFNNKDTFIKYLAIRERKFPEVIYCAIWEDKNFFNAVKISETARPDFLYTSYGYIYYNGITNKIYCK